MTIQGSDTNGTAVQRTIDADRNAASTGSVFNITNAAVTLKNLTLTGGYAANGGGINITSGSVTLSGGTIITGNTATSNGGGIYAAGGTTILSDTTVTGNTATTNGKGIYIASGATVTVQGGTVITTSGTGVNDVYLADSAYLRVGALTGSGTVACITPATYTLETELLSFSSTGLSDSEKVALCNRFEVTKEGTSTYIVNPSGTSGVLAKAGITLAGLAGTYTLTPTTTEGKSGSVLATTDTLTASKKPTLYWTIKGSSGSVVCASDTEDSSVTNAVISIYSHSAPVATGETAAAGYTGTVTLPAYLPADTYTIIMTVTIDGYKYSGNQDVTIQ